MTALAHRRRRSTIVATVVAVGATTAAAGLAVAGGMTIYNSTESSDSPAAVPERVFPPTPTGVVAAVDAEGALASVAVVVGVPSGSGGSIVTLPTSVDASSGEGDERLPVDETVALSGPESLEGELELALNLGVDVVEVVTEARLTELLEPLGPVEVDLPAEVTGADGEVVAAAGPQTLDPAAAAAVLTARDPQRTGIERHAVASAVWAGIAAAAPAGEATGTPADPEAGAIDAVLSPVLGGPVRHLALTSSPAAPARNQRGVDVVILDRVELAIVFGQIAPGHVSAPNPRLSFRVESGFDAEELGDGRTPEEVVYEAISQLLFVRGNVLSVATEPAEVPAVTQVVVSDDGLLTEVRGLDELIGPVEVGVADERIVGIDVVVRLGTSYLDFLAEQDD